MDNLYETEIINRRNEFYQEMLEESSETLIIHYQHQNVFTKQKPFPHYLARWLNLPFYQDFTFIMMPLTKMSEDTDKKPFKTILFVDSDDPAKNIWEGQNTHFNLVGKKYQIDQVIDNDKVIEFLNNLIIDGRKQILFYHDMSERPEQTELNQLIMEFQPAILQPGINLLSPEEIIDQIRVVKSDYEIEMIWKACQISREAHINVLQHIKPGLNESYLDGIFTGHIKMKGCSRTAYPNIIGSGLNSTIIHYHENNQIMKDGDLLLIDAGAEYQGYASDITRTYPVNGKFSNVQRNIYSLVLHVQKICIKMVRPGITFDDLQREANKLISEGLIKLGLLIGTLEQIIEKRAYNKFFMHGIGHWLGLQVHDCQMVPTITWDSEDEIPLVFQPGMIITVEPGIYIGKYLKIDEFVNIKKYKEYYGIGVRIEDDVLVTTNGHKVLSQGIPKEIDEIEHFILG